MSLNIGELAGVLTLDDRPFNRTLDGSERRFGGLSRLAVGAGAAVGAGLAAGAVASVHAFAGFERQMNEVFTLMPGISGQAMDTMTDQVRDFSREFAVLPTEVVPALYQSLSAGVPPGNVFEFLETAQKAAAAGVTDLTTAVDGITSVVNAYGADVLSATNASDLMFTAVRLGKTNFEELSASLFNVTPTAAALGVSFGDVTAALAAMTAQGVPTSVATTQLRQLFVELSKEGSTTSAVFREIAGKSFADFIAAGGNTQTALQLLERHARDTGVGINDLFGSVEAGSAALALTGRGTDAFTAGLEGMQASAEATEVAYEQMAQGLGFQFDRIKSLVAVAMLDVGAWLGPRVGRAIDVGLAAFRELQGGVRAFAAAFRAGDGDITSSGFAGTMERIAYRVRQVWDTAQPFIEWLRANWRPVFIGVAAALAVVAAPFTSVAAALVYAYTRFEGFRDVVQTVVRFLTGTVAPAVATFTRYLGEQARNLADWWRENWDSIREATVHVINYLRTVIGVWVAAISALWSAWGDEILSIAQRVWDQIRVVIETAVGIVRGVIEVLAALINGDWSRAWTAFKELVGTVWRGIAETVMTQIGIVKDVVSGVLSSLRDIWDTAWDGISAALGVVWDTIKGIVFGAVNAVLAAVEGMVNGIIEAVNLALGIIDKLDPRDGQITIDGVTYGTPRGELSVDPISLPRVGGDSGGSTTTPRSRGFAPRIHSGGWFTPAMAAASQGLGDLRGDEGFAILQTGERILSRDEAQGGTGRFVFAPQIIGDPDAWLLAKLERAARHAVNDLYRATGMAV